MIVKLLVGGVAAGVLFAIMVSIVILITDSVRKKV
jgi:hypothetical protein